MQQGPFALRTLLRFIAITSLAATVSPSADFPVVAGYTADLAPPISRWGEDGFSSCSACPCHRAIPNHPAGVLRRVSQSASRHATFAPEQGARPPDLIFSGPPLGSLTLWPGDSLTIQKMALSIGFIRFVPPRMRSSYRALTFALEGLTPTEHASLCWTHCSANIPFFW